MLKYTKDHEWVNIDGNIAKVGITAYAAEQLGDIVFIELPDIGKDFMQKQECAIVESTKAASDIYAPVSGKIIEVNEVLLGNPALVNENPMESWFFKIDLHKLEECDKLLDAPLGGDCA